MNDTRETREIGLPASLRAERSAAALVAQYIHELSARHTRRDEGPTVGEPASPEPVLSQAA